jgi:hypothetical protein
MFSIISGEGKLRTSLIPNKDLHLKIRNETTSFLSEWPWIFQGKKLETEIVARLAALRSGISEQMVVDMLTSILPVREIIVGLLKRLCESGAISRTPCESICRGDISARRHIEGIEFITLESQTYLPQDLADIFLNLPAIASYDEIIQILTPQFASEEAQGEEKEIDHFVRLLSEPGLLRPSELGDVLQDSSDPRPSLYIDVRNKSSEITNCEFKKLLEFIHDQDFNSRLTLIANFPNSSRALSDFIAFSSHYSDLSLDDIRCCFVISPEQLKSVTLDSEVVFQLKGGLPKALFSAFSLQLDCGKHELASQIPQIEHLSNLGRRLQLESVKVLSQQKRISQGDLNALVSSMKQMKFRTPQFVLTQDVIPTDFNYDSESENHKIWNEILLSNLIHKKRCPGGSCPIHKLDIQHEIPRKSGILPERSVAFWRSSTCI